MATEAAAGWGWLERFDVKDDNKGAVFWPSPLGRGSGQSTLLFAPTPTWDGPPLALEVTSAVWSAVVTMMHGISRGLDDGVCGVGENQKEAILTNLEKDAPSLLTRGSILARKSYLRTLADPAEIPLEPALTNGKRGSKLEAQAPIKLVNGHP